MAKSRQIEGVVEAVRVAPDGDVQLVRVYERMGPAFSDRKLLTREQFLERLKAGKLYVAGKREELHGFTFKPGDEITLAQAGGRPVLRSAAAAGSDRTHDDLKGVPLF